MTIREFIPLADPEGYIKAWMCSECEEAFTNKPEECPFCKRERVVQEQKSVYLATTVICPECKGKSIKPDGDYCMWCHEEGRVTKEQEAWLNETVVCPKCDGDPYLSCNWTCDFCDMLGRIQKPL
jgi:DnaJ-class molecular chaperone